jgi:DNA-binding transcriptional ArsR family regulator
MHTAQMASSSTNRFAVVKKKDQNRQRLGLAMNTKLLALFLCAAPLASASHAADPDGSPVGAAAQSKASDLARPLSTSLSATLQRLAVLERSGLVVSAKQGRVRTCRLRPDALTRAERWFAHRRKTLEASFDRLECYPANGEDLNG